MSSQLWLGRVTYHPTRQLRQGQTCGQQVMINERSREGEGEREKLLDFPITQETKATRISLTAGSQETATMLNSMFPYLVPNLALAIPKVKVEGRAPSQRETSYVPSLSWTLVSATSNCNEQDSCSSPCPTLLPPPTTTKEPRANRQHLASAVC